MTDLLLSFSGFAWGALHDIAAVRNTPHVKPWLLALSAAGHVSGFYGLMAHSGRWQPPAWLRLICLLLAPASFCAMLYSIAIEIPFRKAWVEQGHTDELVTGGTYALTRHPGVLWFTCGVLASAVATRSRRLLLATPLLVLGDIAHVRFQEEVVLPRVFGDAYREYQQTTPFVVPTLASMQRFVQTPVAPWRPSERVRPDQ